MEKLHCDTGSASTTDFWKRGCEDESIAEILHGSVMQH
jgi:hypothetical protein